MVNRIIIYLGSHVPDTTNGLNTSADSLYTELEMFNNMCSSSHMTQAMSTDSIDDVDKHSNDEEVSNKWCRYMIMYTFFNN